MVLHMEDWRAIEELLQKNPDLPQESGIECNHGRALVSDAVGQVLGVPRFNLQLRVTII